jgi:hypothetical protein
MKLQLLILLIFCNVCIHAQQINGVLNTYTYPVNEERSNANGQFFRDAHSNYYGFYYDGLATKITNNKEIKLFNFTKGTVNHIQELKPQHYFGYGLENSFYLSPTGVHDVLNLDNTFLINGSYFYTDTSAFYAFKKGSMLYLAYTKNKKIQILDSNAESNGHFAFELFYKYNCIQSDSLIYGKYINNTLEINILKQLKKVWTYTVPTTIIDRDKFLMAPDTNYYYNLIDNDKVIKYVKNENPKFDITYYEVVQAQRASEEHCQAYVNHLKKYFALQSTNKMDRGLFNPASSSLLMHNNNQLTQSFTYIKKYPTLYKDKDALNTFAVCKDAIGNIWAGSYNKGVSKINTNGKVITVNKFSTISNGSLAIGNNVFFIDENLRQIIRFDSKSNKSVAVKTPKNYTGFVLFESKNKTIYFGTAGMGLWYISEKDLLANNGNWTIIPTEKLGDIKNIISIAEDIKGNIWLGHTKRNMAILNPSTQKIQLIKVKNKTFDIGMFSAQCDAQGNMWIGSGYDGLYVANTNKQSIDSSDLKKIQHPFFYTGIRISSLALNGDHLIINAYNKTLALDLIKYKNGAINIKYLTEKESSYTSFTEQNTMVIGNDSSVWFSTSDMLYQWDYKYWLQLPKAKIKLFSAISYGENNDTLVANQTRELPPTSNAFNIALNYYHPDLLPRYLTTALQYKNDSIVWSTIATHTELSFTNLNAGDYTFHIQVCELDGTVSYYKYPITIQTFWYKKWQVILLTTLAILLAIAYILNQRRLKREAIQQLQIQQAEAQSLQAKLQQDLSRLQMNSIGNQFRPHFLLNTLNQLGAYMQGNPPAESIISRLGESIDIVFDHSTANTNTHLISKEIKLVQNVVQIHQIMYLKTLQYNIEPLPNMNEFLKKQIPFGLLQIPIENALLHGLNNRLQEPYLLHLTINETIDNYLISIIDNGIGRKQSAILSSARKHGTGLKNLNELIEILNRKNSTPISLYFEDNIYEDEALPYGTKVNITLPKHFNYDII